MASGDLIDELRQLIVDAAPDPSQAVPVRDCDADDRLDDLIPFSSLIVLGVIVAVEDRYRVRVTRQVLDRAFQGGVTLSRLAAMVGSLEAGSVDAKPTVEPLATRSQHRP